jgi:hypothetical protein
MKLYVKYMVSLRCKLVVKEELKQIGLHEAAVDLGVVEILEDITDQQRTLRRWKRPTSFLPGLKKVEAKSPAWSSNISPGTYRNTVMNPVYKHPRNIPAGAFTMSVDTINSPDFVVVYLK